MAGRGTDIKLGGNKDFVYDGKKEDEKEVKKNEEKVKSLRGNSKVFKISWWMVGC